MIKYITLICFLLINCGKSDTHIDDVLDTARALAPDKYWNEYKGKEEGLAIAEAHFNVGLNFRNSFLKNPEDSSIVLYFFSKGIHHHDDMSLITFKSLHRELNNRPLDLKSQLNDIMLLHKKNALCEEMNITRGQNISSQIKERDTLYVRMPIEGESKNAFMYNCLNEVDWEFDDNKDFLIEGVVVEKYSKYLEIDLKILSVNKNDIRVLMENVKVGDTIPLSLTSNIINIDNISD